MKEQKRKRSGMSFIDCLEEQGQKPVQGILRYTMFKNGVPIEDVKEHNLIVTTGAEPALSDTSIANAFTKGLLGSSYPAAGQVKFSWNLTTAEANGKAILEFGLICEDLTLFSRRIRESGNPINKESDISLEGDWTIIF
jgi:hypothetical protein